MYQSLDAVWFVSIYIISFGKICFFSNRVSGIFNINWDLRRYLECFSTVPTRTKSTAFYSTYSHKNCTQFFHCFSSFFNYSKTILTPVHWTTLLLLCVVIIWKFPPFQIHFKLRKPRTDYWSIHSNPQILLNIHLYIYYSCIVQQKENTLPQLSTPFLVQCLLQLA